MLRILSIHINNCNNGIKSTNKKLKGAVLTEVLAQEPLYNWITGIFVSMATEVRLFSQAFVGVHARVERCIFNVSLTQNGIDHNRNLPLAEI